MKTQIDHSSSLFAYGKRNLPKLQRDWSCHYWLQNRRLQDMRGEWENKSQFYNGLFWLEKPLLSYISGVRTGR